MAKLIKTIKGVPAGEIHPREIAAGEECPENLVDYAKSINALEVKVSKKEFKAK